MNDLPLDYDRLDQTAVASDPFRHVVVENFVPAASLSRVLQGLPPMSSGGSFPPSALRLGEGASALVHALEGNRFRRSVAQKFDLDLDSAPTMLTIRGRTREKDAQIHCDSTAKRVTILLYLNPETEAWARREGCLRLLRNGNDLDDYAVEIPPVNGTLLIFPNGPTTWHGHKTYVGRRYAIQLNYMADGAKARAEIRRHKVSAVLKRFSSAA